MKIKFGLKLWSANTDLIHQAVSLIEDKTFDYIELLTIPGTSKTPFMIDVPYIIHIPHHAFGVNIGDASSKEYNINIINESIIWADQLDAKYLILHAGHGSMENAKDLLHDINDTRILMENMPKVGLDNENMIGYSPEQISDLIGDSNFGLCLDLGHASKAAISLTKDYKEYIKKFLRLNPKLFHISDGNLTNEKDEHLTFGKGELDLSYLLGCIQKSKSPLVTLEAHRMNKHSLQEDIQNVKFLSKFTE